MSRTGNGDGARNDESDSNVHTGDGDGAHNDESDGDGNCEIQKSKNTSMEGPSSTYEWNPDEIVHHATKMVQIKKMIPETTMSNIEKAQQKDKFYYDRKHSNEQVRVISMLCVVCKMLYLQEFLPGELVLLQNSHRDSKKGDKLQPRWLEPYRVYEALENAHGRVLKTAVNGCRLIRFNDPTPLLTTMKVITSTILIERSLFYLYISR